ncbi:hypothetical protein SAMN05421770_11030 [Granulicella rosea]|uniref:Outer membrane protein beta-barrel domain-containing protein n=1 Tax=Granulicella rosea TaxID=474952 RepID=A0A239M5W8_9BACT|nr:hypothetical protein [Granulicella rosea]SNT38105.1 hypothetical protein SAMN05421770_11030 [Granulicella rosea]
MKIYLIPVLLLSIGATLADAQNRPAEPLPEAPLPSQRTALPAPKPSTIYNESYVVRAGYMCGAGASTSPVATKPTTGCGVGFTFIPLPIFTEIGIMAPQANRSYFTGYVSVDGSIPLASMKLAYLPMAIVGYSRLFETGHAFDYGLALAMPHKGKPGDYPTSLRLELRDYWTFANPTQHNVMLRLGWMSVETD